MIVTTQQMGETGKLVFNVLGEPVYSLDKLNEINSIDVSNWNSGIYFYKISDKKGFCKQGKFFVN